MGELESFAWSLRGGSGKKLHVTQQPWFGGVDITHTYIRTKFYCDISFSRIFYSRFNSKTLWTLIKSLISTRNIYVTN